MSPEELMKLSIKWLSLMTEARFSIDYHLVGLSRVGNGSFLEQSEDQLCLTINLTINYFVATFVVNTNQIKWS